MSCETDATRISEKKLGYLTCQDRVANFGVSFTFLLRLSIAGIIMAWIRQREGRKAVVREFSLP